MKDHDGPVYGAPRALRPVYETIGDHLGAMVRHHYTMIDQWVSVFPCRQDQGAGADAKMIATAVMDAVEAFQAGTGRSDDFTCVAVKFST